jgi:hypothetical protein
MLMKRYNTLPLWEGVGGIWSGTRAQRRYRFRRVLWRADSPLAFAFDVVGDLVYLVEDVAVAVYKVGDFGVGVHDGGVVATAEGASDLW